MSNYNELDMVVLKTIINNKKHGLDFANEFDTTKQQFFSADVWNFANLVVGYIRTYKELPTLRVISEKLSKGNNEKLLENVKKVWDSLEKIQYDEKEYKHDLEKLKKRYAEKQITTVQDTLSKFHLGGMDVSKAVSEMQKAVQSIKNLEHHKTYESKDIKDYLSFFVDRFNAKKDNPKLEQGLLTKYSFFDHATNGLRGADFVVIAGETGFGKSLFLNNIAIQTWLQGHNISDKNIVGKNVIYFSLEMPYEDCFNRLISRLSGVPSRNIENAQLSREEFNKVKSCLDFIKEYPYQFKIVDIADASANDIESILTDTGEKFDAIFIDYLGIMKTNEKTDEQDWIKQGIIAYEVRAIARKYNIPILSAVQLNRKNNGKESSENIGLSRLARSATIATHVTHVIQIESRPNEEKYPDFIYHFIKNRKGPKGKGVLIKNLSCATLIDNVINDVSSAEYDEYFKNQDDISEKLEDLEI